MKFLFIMMSGLLTLSNTVYGQTSEQLRNDKGYALATGLGVRTSSMLEKTLIGSYFIQPNTMINMYLSKITGSIKESTEGNTSSSAAEYVPGVTTEAKGAAIAFSYKHFFGNTFYVDGGLDYAKISGTFHATKSVFNTSSDLANDLGGYKKLSAMVQIGNQWQWDNFTLGTSWIGLLAPIYASNDFQKDYPALQTYSNSATKFTTAATRPQMTVLRFYLGCSF